jgi:hypothetical protein
MLIVNQRHPRVDNDNAGSVSVPPKTLATAAEQARPGAVIYVHPGIYRERVMILQSGTAEKPIRLEGIRDREGQMPVFSGNDPFSADA